MADLGLRSKCSISSCAGGSGECRRRSKQPCGDDDVDTGARDQTPHARSWAAATPERKLFFELRNGPAIEPRIVDKVDDQWVEIDRRGERLVRREHGEKLDAERRRKHDVILQLLYDESAEGRVYTGAQFADRLENQGGLGGKDTIRERLGVLTTKGYVKFFRNAYGLPPATRSKFGYLCVGGMHLGPVAEAVDPDTGEMITTAQWVLPTHYMCPQSGAVLPVENPEVRVYLDDGEAAG